MVDRIKEMEEKRSERRKKMDEERLFKQQREAQNEAGKFIISDPCPEGKKAIDIDFQLLLEQARIDPKSAKPVSCLFRSTAISNLHTLTVYCTCSIFQRAA